MILALKMALRSISANKLRAVLTMLGIVIGVMALVVLVSLVSGATGSVTDAVASLGSDLLTVTVTDDKGNPYQLDTLQELADNSTDIGYVAPYATASVTGKYGTDYDSFTVYGTTPVYSEIEGLQLYLGRFIKSSDVDNATRICVINNAAAEDIIGYTDCIGEEISLGGMKYTIVGVLSDEETIANAILGGYTAYVPYTSLLRLSDSVSGDISTFVVSAGEGKTVSEAENAVNLALLERFDDDEDAFSVSSMNVMEDAMSSITSVLSVLLGGIAGISLIVGGIGIMNIMLVTVTERTREIGIRKAIGASRAEILRQFLMESTLLCMMGCAIGIFLSWTVLRVAAAVVSSLSIRFRLNGSVVAIAVLFCFFIGVVFGLYPANKAAKMKPIEALHYGG